jgi:uncharacterized phage-associated protein/uncharacterized Zn finger protein (UPF0148 family)
MMMNERREYCYNCDDDKLIMIKEELISMKIKEVEFEFTGKVAYCKECGEEVYVSEIDDENVRKGNEKYREKLGIIQISEIEELLRKYNIGKKPLAKLLGWGEVTIIRYLKGLTPSKEYSEKLKELRDPYKMQEILNKNGDALQRIARQKVENRINQMLNISKSTKKDNDIKAIDVSTYFLSKVDDEAGDFISHLKLQKLVYYAQAWTLVFFNKPILEEDFQAWVHGPIIPNLYSNYNKFGKNPIPKVTVLDESIFDKDEKLILEGIWNVYGKYNAKYLEALIHEEDPWRNARGDCKEDEQCMNVITKEGMKDYYASIKKVLRIKTMDDLDDYVSSIKI